MKKTYTVVALLALGAAMAITPAAQAENWAKYKIMLDPGHGGTDPGASGPTAPHEATLALRCAKALTKKFDNLGNPYKLTRTTDTYISLQARKNASVSYDPYIFCSIHLNAFNGTANGTETWYYWSTGNSKLLANCVQATLISEMGRTNRGVKQNGWTVITGSASIPAILTEGLFVDNKTEHDLIKTEGSAGFNKWVNGHLYGFYDRLKLLSSTITNPRGGTTTPTTEPTITVPNTSWAFSCLKGETDEATFKITAKDLTSAITVSCDNPLFALSTTSIAKTGGNLTVTFKPTEAGSQTATITFKSTGAANKTIKVTGEATAPRLAFTEKWNFSDKNGTATYKGWDATKVRNMTHYKGKLYLVYEHSDIKVVKAQAIAADDNGVLGNLNKGDVVKGGILTLCDVKACNGKIVACNLGGKSGDQMLPLRVYVWDNDQAMARLAMETTDFGGATRLGDCIGWKGTWTDGELVFGNDDGSATRIVTYAVKDGVISATPTVKNATTDGTKQLKTASSTRVYPQSNGLYWIDGKDNHTAHLDASGKQQYYMDRDVSWGNALATFTWEGTKYALATNFNPMEGENWNTQTAEQKAKNYTGGRMTLYDCSESYAKPVKVADYPKNGLSDTRQNTNCTGNVIIKNTDGTIEAWVLSTNQGIAYYLSKGGTAPTYPADNFATIPVITTKPEITASAKSLSMEALFATSDSKSVKVTGTGLKGDITVSIAGADTDVFTTTTSSIPAANGSATATVTVKFRPTQLRTFTADLVLSSPDAPTVTVALSGLGLPNISYATELGSLDQKWIYSANTGNLDKAPWFMTEASVAPARSIAVKDNNLYVLNGRTSAANTNIQIVNANTGASTGKTLSVDGVAGGTFCLASLGTLGNDVIASNFAEPKQSLKVYKWTNGAGAPAVLFEDATHGGINVGEHMGVYGDMNNGKLAFSDGNKVLIYTVTNGAVNPDAVQTVTLAESAKGNRSSQQIHMDADGTFWLVNKDKYPTHYSADGQVLETIDGKAVGQQYGTAMARFTYADVPYAAVVTTLGGATSKAWSNAAMNILDLRNGAGAAVSKGIYPSGGLGEPAWGPVGVTDVKHRISGENNSLAEFWVMAPLQGIAHYAFNGRTTGVETITVGNQEGADAEYYNLQGVKVDKDNLAPGLYIRVRGKAADKVIVK